MSDLFTEAAHPSDPAYQRRRRQMVDKFLQISPQAIDRQLNYQMAQDPPSDPDYAMSRRIVRELRNSITIPDRLKGILDSTGATTGQVMIRQDLEAGFYSLFVKKFPLFDRLRKAQSNGLVHAATQITVPDVNTTPGSTLTGELGTVAYTNGNYNRVTFPIGVFATGRGVSIKEIAAVQAGGAPYDPLQSEMGLGMVKLAQDVQYQLLQGNFSNAGGTLTQETGLYNALGIDGLRGVTGSAGIFAANNAIQMDIGTLGIMESIQTVTAKAANNGGNPTAAIMSMNAKQALDIEQQANRRYTDNQTDLIPGVRANQIGWANGDLTVIPIPGSTVGTYQRTSDGMTVEDIYLIDENVLTIRWLFSEGFTVLQIPSGVDAMLSDRYIIFGMFGFEIAAPSFNAKVRKQAN